MRILSLTILSMLASGAFAQSPTELNRSGRWAEAAEIASHIIADEEASLEECCIAYNSLIYAEIRLGKLDDAAQHLSEYDAACEGVLPSAYAANVDRLRAELQPSAPSTNSAQELNRSGRWAEAAEIAERDIHTAAPSSAEKCIAYVSAAYARYQLENAAEAAEHIRGYDAECADTHLPGARQEINHIREQLGLGPDPNAFEALPMRPEPPAPSASAGDDWPKADPAELGLDTLALADHKRLCEQGAADACLVVYNRQIVQELYGPHYSEPMYAMSTTKSITGLLVGMLIDDGKLALDDPVAKYIPEWKAGAEADVTVRHLLTMTAGLKRLFGEGLPSASDKEAFVFELPLTYKPGERWEYTNEGVFLLSPLLDQAAGEPIEDYARRRLFEPLGMKNTRFHVSPQGQAWTHAALETTPRDLARIGLLMLNGGRWEGEQIVPESWVKASTQPIPQKPNYGLLWWLHDDPEGYAGHGYLETNLDVFPELDLVVVRMQSKPVGGAELYEPAALDLFKRLQHE